MSAIIFGHYHITGTEGAPFEVGNEVLLDGCDGFFDQSLDSSKPGDELLFFVNDDISMPDSEPTLEQTSPDFLDALFGAIVVSGRIKESGAVSAIFKIEKQQTLRELMNLVIPPSQDDVTQELKTLIATIDREKRIPDGDIRFVRHLVNITAVQKASSENSTISSRISNPLISRRSTPLSIIEPINPAKEVRILSLGDNDINSCRICTISDADTYRIALELAAMTSTNDDEKTLWYELLDPLCRSLF